MTDGLRAFGGAYGGAFQGGSAGLVAQPSDESTGVGAKLMGEVPLKLVEGGEDLPSEAGNGHFRFTGGDLYFGTSTGWKNLTNPASSGATTYRGDPDGENYVMPMIGPMGAGTDNHEYSPYDVEVCFGSLTGTAKIGLRTSGDTPGSVFIGVTKEVSVLPAVGIKP